MSQKKFLFTWAEKPHDGLCPFVGDIFPRVSDNICVQSESLQTSQLAELLR